MHVVVAGYGVEGKSNVRYFLSKGHKVSVIDEKEINEHNLPKEVNFICRKNILQEIDNISPKPDIVVRSAGIAPYKIKTDAKVWSATNEFFQYCPVPIIGVTGSKGKGTTCSLIASILKYSGKNVHLVGNIGIPALDILDEIETGDVVVYELSSFQLWDIEYSPNMAIILHIEPDHLDVHKDFEDYLKAKSNIVLFQDHNDICLYEPNNKYSEAIASNQPKFDTHSVKYGVPNKDSKIKSVYVKDNKFCLSSDEPICSTDELKIPGKHNIYNATAAISACLNAFSDVSPENIKHGLNNFTGLDHRLKFVEEVGLVKYYDDSIATTPGSAVAACESFVEPKVMILGGSSKGADFSSLAQTLADSRVRKVLLIGEEAHTIKEQLDVENIKDYKVLGKNIDMQHIALEAYKYAKPGDVVILSPACASFDMFDSYMDRGDKFIKSVKYLKNKHDK